MCARHGPRSLIWSKKYICAGIKPRMQQGSGKEGDAKVFQVHVGIAEQRVPSVRGLA